MFRDSSAKQTSFAWFYLVNIHIFETSLFLAESADFFGQQFGC
jgi:hypothetical protein